MLSVNSHPLQSLPSEATVQVRVPVLLAKPLFRNRVALQEGDSEDAL
jgi:hypothetical protein